MKLFLVVLSVMVAAPAFAAVSAGDRATALQIEVKHRGLAAVAKEATSKLDKQLLRMIADLTEDAEAQRILGPEEPFPAGHVSGPGELFIVKAPLFLNGPEGYTVVFSNATDELLSEVTVFWQKKGAPLVEPPAIVAPLAPYSNTTFLLGACTGMWRYSLGVFIGGHMIMRIPAAGGMITPEIANRFNPADQSPCSDSWTFHKDIIR